MKYLKHLMLIQLVKFLVFFLDISKAFDRVWHDGLFYKIKTFGVEGNLYHLIKSFLTNRHQRVTINGQSSDWLPVNAGVPQGSILGPLLFLIYINDLPDGLLSSVKLFADDTALFSHVTSPIESANKLNHDILKIADLHINGKFYSILILPNKQKKLYFL